ncbi:hypothetical protein, conserved [Entamoeba dispar SAW760]|uniref:CCR4-NOT transcription complex subunit 1 CAF1-binding domain-containing protein n=1 Tax=Entamoeba dispar (strain ATCC PRA-260 / SAW760) TaxID=370354 RepID=B0EQR6_ENTDS|nr:uncharacterized protein EDI_258090 [Entamoeba dispar SAW760]EDR23131.1 hypothetical protein, conserved [Entamoeba dispar SAW760]|eukprot:EDR23131.1 hypothetical protein, conserved [Entamoeba dispar SAW760]
MTSSELLQIKILFESIQSNNPKTIIKQINEFIKKVGRKGIIYYLSLLLSTKYKKSTEIYYEELSHFISQLISSPFFEGIFFEAINSIQFNCDISKLTLKKHELQFLQHLLALHHGEFLSLPIEKTDIPKDELLQNFYEDPHYVVNITQSTHPSPIFALHWTNPITLTLPQNTIILPIRELIEEFSNEELNEFITEYYLTTEECILCLDIICKRKIGCNTPFLSKVEWSVVISQFNKELKEEEINYICLYLNNCKISTISFNLLISFITYILSNQKNIKIIKLLVLSLFNQFNSIEELFNSNDFFEYMKSKGNDVINYNKMNSIIIEISNKYPNVICKYIEWGRIEVIKEVIENQRILVFLIENNKQTIEYLIKEYEKSSKIISSISKVINSNNLELILKFKSNKLMMIDLASILGINAIQLILNENMKESILLFLKYKEEKNQIVSNTTLSKPIYTILIEFIKINKIENQISLNENEINLLEEVLNNKITINEFCNSFECIIKNQNEINKNIVSEILQFLCDGLIQPPIKGSSIIGDIVGELLKRKIIKGVMYIHIVRIIINQLDDINKPTFYNSLIVLEKLKKTGIINGGIAKTLRNYSHINQINTELYSYINAQCNKPRVSEMDILKSLINENYFNEPMKKCISKTIQNLINWIFNENDNFIKDISHELKDEIAIFIVAIHSTIEQQKKLLKICDFEYQIQYCTTAIQHNHFNKISHIDHCIGIGKWLGTLTLHQNKPILMIQLNLKPFIISKCKVHSIEGAGFFLVNLLKGIKGSIFTIHNPWIFPLIEILKEIYKLNLSGLKQEIAFFLEQNGISLNLINSKNSSTSLQLNELPVKSLINIPNEECNIKIEIDKIPRIICTTELTEKEWKIILKGIITSTIKEVIEGKKGMIERLTLSIKELIMKDIEMISIPNKYKNTILPMIICRLNSISIIRMIISNIHIPICECSKEIFNKMILYYIPQCWMEYRIIPFDEYKEKVFKSIEVFNTIINQKTLEGIIKELLKNISISLNENQIYERINEEQKLKLNNIPFEKQIELNQNIGFQFKNKKWTISLFDKEVVKLIVHFICITNDKLIGELLINNFIQNQNINIQHKTMKYLIKSLIYEEETSENGIDYKLFEEIIETIIDKQDNSSQVFFIKNLFKGIKDLINTEKNTIKEEKIKNIVIILKHYISFILKINNTSKIYIIIIKLIDKINKINNYLEWDLTQLLFNIEVINNILNNNNIDLIALYFSTLCNILKKLNLLLINNNSYEFDVIKNAFDYINKEYNQFLNVYKTDIINSLPEKSSLLNIVNESSH